MSSSIPTSGPAKSRTDGDGSPANRGQLKVFLGYAAGVGKTFRMLEEAQRLKERGVDVVVGYFEPHARKNTIARSEGLEVVPRRKLSYHSSTFEEMDTAAILRRHPDVCLVDELAHTNVPGAERSKRWEDVEVLLDAGISVLTTLNVQHLESLNDHVFEISKIRVRETVPDWVVRQADEVIMVDATTGALLNRLKRGDVYDPAKAEKAMENFFKESTLTALRELALRQTAHELELREEETTEREQTRRPASARSVENRILVNITADPSTAMLIRRGRRVADFLGSECFAVFVSPHSDLAGVPKEEREAIEKHLSFARNLHIETRVLEGEDSAETLVEFAKRNQIAQILLARPRYTWLSRAIGSGARSPNFVMKVIQRAKDMRVVIVAERRHVQ